ncbi:MAG: pallilysin-related adhesin, partial [Spirochaetales bacterium]|nr:pallilysin-related adhesin [Spirochaetales bacterium]
MKHFLLIIAFFILLTGCQQTSTTDIGKPIEVNPVYNNNISKNEVKESIVNIPESESDPKVTLNPNDMLIDLIDTNLDLDSHDEQILIVKDNSVNGSPVRVLVADFDYIMNSYSVSWKAETGSDNIRSFSISLTDITGDHNLEIVCSGTDLDGKETLNIYRRTPSQGGLILHFSEIINLKIEGNIEVKEEQRTQAYQTGISGGVSFPIIVTTTDPDSDNILDLTQSTYFWRNQEASYKLISVD